MTIPDAFMILLLKFATIAIRWVQDFNESKYVLASGQIPFIYLFFYKSIFYPVDHCDILYI